MNKVIYLIKICTVHSPLIHVTPHGTVLPAALDNEGSRPEPHLPVQDPRLLVTVVHVKIVLTNVSICIKVIDFILIAANRYENLNTII